MTYFEKQLTNFSTLKKEDAELLSDLTIKEKDILFYYDLPLIFILSSDKNPDIKFLGYMFSSIDDDILKYYLLEKTNEEINSYLNNQIDLLSFLKIGTELKERRAFVEKTGNNFTQVLPFDQNAFEHTLGLIKSGLFYDKRK